MLGPFLFLRQTSSLMIVKRPTAVPVCPCFEHRIPNTAKRSVCIRKGSCCWLGKRVCLLLFLCTLPADAEMGRSTELFEVEERLHISACFGSAAALPSSPHTTPTCSLHCLSLACPLSLALSLPSVFSSRGPPSVIPSGSGEHSDPRC